MDKYHNIESMPFIENAVVTVGTFDGVHLAHRAILRAVVRLAKNTRGESVVVTFNIHPKKIIYPDFQEKELSSAGEKCVRLTSAGIRTAIYLDFNTNIAETYYYDFIKLLASKMTIKKMVVGYDHHFGKNKEGDVYNLKKLSTLYGFEVVEIPKQEMDEVEISSSHIRRLINIGDMKSANKFLGYNYRLFFRITSSTDDYFVVKNVNTKKVLPPEGVYEIKILGNNSTPLEVNEDTICIRKENVDIDKIKKDYITVKFS